MTRLLLSLLTLCAAARADFDPARYEFRRAFLVAKTAPVASFTIDLALYQGSRARLSDLRIVRDGSETPYVIRTLSGAREEREWKPALLNKAAVPGTGLEATLDLGAHPTHNRLRIATHQKNFKQRVRIETSDDGRAWAIARDDGYIFDFSQGDRKVSVLSVDYPPSTRRFVKFTIFGWSDPDYLDSAWLTYYTSTSGTTIRSPPLQPRQPRIQKLKARCSSPTSDSTVSRTIGSNLPSIPHSSIAPWKWKQAATQRIGSSPARASFREQPIARIPPSPFPSNGIVICGCAS